MNQIKKSGIVGLGKVGLTLARDLFNRNQLLWLCSESYIPELVLEEFPGVEFNKNISSITSLSDILIIAKADKYISETLNTLRNQFGSSLSGKVIMHLSGSKGIELFKEFDETGAFTASAHPYQTFYNPDPSILKDICWGVQTNHSFELIEQIISGFGGKAINITHLSTLEKTLYHASAVTVSNYLNTLAALGRSIAKSAGIDPELFIPPIMKTTLENNFVSDDIPLTGPIARADIETLVSHLEALTDYPLNLRSYCLIGLTTADRAYSSEILSKEMYEKINQLFKKYL